MSELKERLRADLTAAMKARDSVQANTIRMALTAISTAEVAGASARELSDEETQAVLTKEAKKRRESATAYDDAGRPELAETERAELAILEGYLPQQLNDEELTDLVTAAISEAGATSMKDMGAVMRIVQPRVAGRAEGGRIAAEVRRQLG